MKVQQQFRYSTPIRTLRIWDEPNIIIATTSYTIALCFRLLTLNPLPQTSHLNGFWLVCANIWTSRFFQFKQIFPQTLHFMSSNFSSNFSFFVGSGTDIGMAWEAFNKFITCFSRILNLRIYEFLHMLNSYISIFLSQEKTSTL